MDVGGIIKKFRIANNLKQSELADLLQVTAQAVSSWERNRTQPNMETIERMCAVFNCKKSDFWDEAPISLDSLTFIKSGEGRHHPELPDLDLTPIEKELIEYFRKANLIYQLMALRLLGVPESDYPAHILRYYELFKNDTDNWDI